MEAKEYNAKKERMLLESQSRKWHIDTTLLWCIVVTFICRIIRIHSILFFYYTFFNSEPLLFAYYIDLLIF